MFNCPKCELTIGPKVSPIFVPKATRSVAYPVVKEDEDGNEIMQAAKGTEFTGEYLLCPPCAGVEPHVPKVANWDGLRAAFGAFTHKHVRNCKKDVQECLSCQHFLAEMRTVALAGLNAVHAPIIAVPLTTKLAAIANYNVGQRSYHNSKRAAADIQAAYNHMAPYANRGGGLD